MRSKMRRNIRGKRSNPHSGLAWASTFRTGCSGRVRMNPPMRPIKGLYAVTPDVADTSELVSKVAIVLAAGARVLQYRNKRANDELRREQAGALKSACRQYDALLIINDDVALASDIAADGVHVGRDDLAFKDARAQLGRDKLIGVSCYDNL